MRKPIIAITPQYDWERNRVWMRPQYCSSVFRAGGVPVLLDQIYDTAYAKDICDSCDGILFTGGVDINPKHYGEEVLPECGEIADKRDEFELPLYAEAAKRDMPILGICRGIQLINVAAGGTLCQHVPAHAGVKHDVEIARGSLLYDILGKDTIYTNSSHHQCVKMPAPNMTAQAWSNLEESGRLIESIYDPDARFNLGVQWHPENLFYNDNDEDSKRIFEAYIAACSEYVKAKGE